MLKVWLSFFFGNNLYIDKCFTFDYMYFATWLYKICFHSRKITFHWYSQVHRNPWDNWCRAWHQIYLLYAVKAQTSLAPLSWFPGSRIPTAHVHQCCRFQSYANSHAIAYDIYKRNLQSVNHIPGIHDNGRPVMFDFNSVLRAMTLPSPQTKISNIWGSFHVHEWGKTNSLWNLRTITNVSVTKWRLWRFVTFITNFKVAASERETTPSLNVVG